MKVLAAVVAFVFLATLVVGLALSLFGAFDALTRQHYVLGGVILAILGIAGAGILSDLIRSR